MTINFDPTILNRTRARKTMTGENWVQFMNATCILMDWNDEDPEMVEVQLQQDTDTFNDCPDIVMW